jgi:hypothetical protein
VICRFFASRGGFHCNKAEPFNLTSPRTSLGTAANSTSPFSWDLVYGWKCESVISWDGIESHPGSHYCVYLARPALIFLKWAWTRPQ